MMLPLAFLAFSLVDGWRWDEKLMLSATALAAGGLLWAFAYTTAEGALRPQRFAFRRAGEALLLAAIYAAARVWL
jgi:hypothetical protein